jgi:hypothetical protein
MAQFTPQYQSGTFSMVNGAGRPYFGGRLVGAERWPRFPRQVLPVRRGSIEPATANDAVKFATYSLHSGTSKSRSNCTWSLDALNPRTQTSSQTNFTAPNAITTGSLTTSLNWNSSLALSNQSGPNGDTASIGYDSSGRPPTITSPYGAITAFSYSSSPPQTLATVTTNNRWTRTTMDGFGRTIKTEAADSSGTVQSVTDAQYAACGCSPLGKLSQQSRPIRLVRAWPSS